MKIFGVLLGLMLFLTPLTLQVKAEDSLPQEEARFVSKNPLVIFRNLLSKRLEEQKAELEADKAETTNVRSRFEDFQRKFEDVLKKLNNTI